MRFIGICRAEIVKFISRVIVTLHVDSEYMQGYVSSKCFKKNIMGVDGKVVFLLATSSGTFVFEKSESFSNKI